MNLEPVIRGFYRLIEKSLTLGGYKEEIIDLPEAELHTLHFPNLKSDVNLVLLHGIGASAIQFCKILLPLRKHFEVWAPNLPTYINSSKVKGDKTYFTAVEQAKVLSPWLDKLAKEKPLYLVGMSYGAWIAFEYTLMNPEKVRRISVIDGAGLSLGAKEARAYFVNTTDDNETLKLLNLIYTRWKWGLWMWAPFFRTVWSHPSVQQVLHEKERQEPLDDRLNEIDIPVKIIWGEEDKLFSKEVAENFDRLIPNSKLVFIPNCGHSPPIERADLCVKELLEF